MNKETFEQAKELVEGIEARQRRIDALTKMRGVIVCQFAQKENPMELQPNAVDQLPGVLKIIRDYVPKAVYLGVIDGLINQLTVARNWAEVELQKL